MFNFRPTYQPLITFCKELIAEKKALMEENEELKAELKKRVADLEEQLEKKLFLLDDEGKPIKSFTLTGKLVLMEEPEPAEEKLEVGKWYDARTFDVATLKKLLPVGTLVTIITDWDIDEKRNLTNCDIFRTAVSPVTSIESEVDEHDREETYIYVDRYKVVTNNWFKIPKEY